MEFQMNTMKSLLLLAVVTLLCLPACNYTPEGECWYKDQGSENAGAGVGSGGVILPPSPPGGDQGFGDAPPRGPQDAPNGGPKCNSDDETESPKDPCPGVGDTTGDGATFLSCSDACSSKCPPPGAIPVVKFGPSVFPFVTTIPDDGQGKGGGWQVAKVNLEFKRVFIPISVTTWYCPFNIEMPLRTEGMGRIDANRAASLSVEITEDVARGMDYSLPQGIFCFQFVQRVDGAFKTKYKLLGATAVKK
jgi:hypothetical protein